MELAEAYLENPVKSPVYGIITSVKEWIFTKYLETQYTRKKDYMNNWEKSEIFTIRLPDDINNFGPNLEEDTRDIASYVNGMIVLSVNDCEKSINSLNSSLNNNELSQ